MSEVTTQSNPMNQFKSRVTEKLKSDIGELLPDEALTGLIETAIQEQFFNPKITKNNYGNVIREEPSWFVQAVTEAIKPMLEKEVKEAVKKCEPLIQKAINEQTEENKVAVIIGNQITSSIECSISYAVNELRNFVR